MPNDTEDGLEIKSCNLSLEKAQANHDAATYHVYELHVLVLTCLQDFWAETAVKGLETATFGSVFYPKLE